MCDFIIPSYWSVVKTWVPNSLMFHEGSHHIRVWGKGVKQIWENTSKSFHKITHYLWQTRKQITERETFIINPIKSKNDINFCLMGGLEQWLLEPKFEQCLSEGNMCDKIILSYATLFPLWASLVLYIVIGSAVIRTHTFFIWHSHSIRGSVPPHINLPVRIGKPKMVSTSHVFL